jgi:NADPH:quinone reductase-like Zn-dependent oxidoreductase
MTLTIIISLALTIMNYLQASTVTHNDCILRRGMSPNGGQVSLPATPGFDVVGHIVAVGDSVEDFEVDDRVAALIRTGGNARYAVVPSGSLVHVPRSLSPADAASVVSTYMTAYQAFQKATEHFKEEDNAETKNVLKGKKVLVTGGLGPIGQALIELSKKAGASKVVATAPEHRHTYLRMVLGVKPLPPLPQDWLPLVKGNMDVVFDGQCQDGFESPQRALNDNGVLMCVGMHGLLNSEGMGVFGAPMSAIWTSTKANWFMSQTKTYEVWSSFQNDPEKFKSDLEHVFDMLKKRQIKTHVARRITLADVSDAHLFIEKGKARGTIVCMPWQRRRSLHEKDDGDGGEREE